MFLYINSVSLSYANSSAVANQWFVCVSLNCATQSIMANQRKVSLLTHLCIFVLHTRVRETHTVWGAKHSGEKRDTDTVWAGLYLQRGAHKITCMGTHLHTFLSTLNILKSTQCDFNLLSNCLCESSLYSQFSFQVIFNITSQETSRSYFKGWAV